jgi:hypothetical protein
VLAQGDGVGGRLEREGVLAHPRDAVRGADRAGGDDERVVGDRPAGVAVHRARRDVDTGDRGHSHLDVALPAEDAADRVGDVVDVEARGGHLVQQRLEGVEVVGVDEHHVDRFVAEALHHGEAAEARADHHHAMATAVARHVSLAASARAQRPRRRRGC